MSIWQYCVSFACRLLVIIFAPAMAWHMRFGVDFGTTHTTVAYADRGNYPVVSFGNEAGDWIDYIPSLVAWDGAKLVYGFEAEAVALTGAISCVQLTPAV